jgi:RNA polymerase sigma-70 factor (ECF subfamily)
MARDGFATTRWTVVLRAGRAEGATGALAALGELCQAYWYPLYAFARRSGLSAHDAEDRVQGFFARLIRLNSLAELSREKGRFRAFLLASLKHYLSDERERERADKRDARRTVSWDALEAEARYASEPADRLTPERLYERQWALALLESVARRLRGEYESAGKGELYAALQGAVTGCSPDYGEQAARLGQSEGALRVAAHRLRQRYRALLREEIAQTVERPEDVEAELAELRRVLSA